MRARRWDAEASKGRRRGAALSDEQAGRRALALLANVDVVLSDREGKQPAVKFTARAPICLVQAPAGRYQVEALFRDEKRTLAATVAKDAKQPGMLVFRFPEAN